MSKTEEFIDYRKRAKLIATITPWEERFERIDFKHLDILTPAQINQAFDNKSDNNNIVEFGQIRSIFLENIALVARNEAVGAGSDVTERVKDVRSKLRELYKSAKEKYKPVDITETPEVSDFSEISESPKAPEAPKILGTEPSASKPVETGTPSSASAPKTEPFHLKPAETRRPSSAPASTSPKTDIPTPPVLLKIKKVKDLITKYELPFPIESLTPRMRPKLAKITELEIRDLFGIGKREMVSAESLGRFSHNLRNTLQKESRDVYIGTDLTATTKTIEYLAKGLEEVYERRGFSGAKAGASFFASSLRSDEVKPSTSPKPQSSKSTTGRTTGAGRTGF